jgi:hypothetical protein
MPSFKAHGALRTIFHIRRTGSRTCRQEQGSCRCSRSAHSMCPLTHLDLIGDVDSGAGLGHVVQQQDREVGRKMCCQRARLVTVQRRCFEYQLNQFLQSEARHLTSVLVNRLQGHLQVYERCFHTLISYHGDQPCMPAQLTSDCCRAGKKQSARLGRCFRCRALRDGQQRGSTSSPGPFRAQLYESSNS